MEERLARAAVLRVVAAEEGAEEDAGEDVRGVGVLGLAGSVRV